MDVQEGIWRCNICFEEVPGTHCLRAASCDHFFCLDCLRRHCQTQLRDKRLDMLLCPESGCKQPLHRAVSVLFLAIMANSNVGRVANGLFTLRDWRS